MFHSGASAAVLGQDFGFHIQGVGCSVEEDRVFIF